jgi:exodeoxyribonuclease-5
VDDAYWRGGEHEISWKERLKLDEFAYGYALTVHKAQGSQWDDVLVYDESGVFREDAGKWLYTAVTRAATRVTLAVD